MARLVPPSPFELDLRERLARVRVVLVEPKYAANIGQVARAMATAGFSRLELVAPRAALDLDAIRWSMGGRALLEAAGRHERLEDALEGVDLPLAVSRFGGRHRPNPMRPRTAAGLVMDLLPSRTVALVFGAEDRGLSRASADRAWGFVSIPTGGTPSLNLGQAVAVVLHAFTELCAEGPVGPPEDVVEREHAADRLLGLLERVGFLDADDRPRMAAKLLELFARVHPDRREVRIVHGIVGQVERHLATVSRREGPST